MGNAASAPLSSTADLYPPQSAIATRFPGVQHPRSRSAGNTLNRHPGRCENGSALITKGSVRRRFDTGPERVDLKRPEWQL